MASASGNMVASISSSCRTRAGSKISAAWKISANYPAAQPTARITSTACAPGACPKRKSPKSSSLFAAAAERARKADLDGIELHSANGYLFTQFLSSAINDRNDRYGGSLENRARFLMEVIAAIQKRVGRDFPLIVKLTGHDHHNAAGIWPRPDGNNIDDAIQVAQWVEAAGVHAIHVSTGNMFPHPLNPAGPMAVDVGRRTYQNLIASGQWTFRNFLGFRYFGWFVRWLWSRKQPFWRADGTLDVDKLEGLASR